MNQEIFIQIAAYRDPELLPTMRDALEKAKYAERLTFGVCFQDSEQAEDYDELLRFLRCRVIRIEPKDSKGVCAARALTQTLWRGESYTLQIDSHMRFVSEWDEILIDMLCSCGEKAVLTAYCPAYEPENPIEYDFAEPLTLGADYFNAYGSLMLAARMPIGSMAKPVAGAFWSGHFSFSDAGIINDVPYDAKLYFHGEEISYAVRAWTKGYNIFYPNKTVCFHYYQRKGRPTNWSDRKE